MAVVSAIQVKELREKTGAGMLDCKNALAESNGDMEQAVEVLRKKGIANAEKKASRLASEGLVATSQKADAIAMVEVNCETDFVGKTPDFQEFVSAMAKHVVTNRPENLEALLAQEFAGGKTVSQVTQEKVAKIGENIGIRRFRLIELKTGELAGSYIHMGSKIGAVVKVKGDAGKIDDDALRGVAMHVAAAAPRFVRADQIPQEVLDKEKEIYLAQMQDSGKPENILEKIIEGKVKKFAAEVCIEDQIYIKDPDGKQTVKKYLQSLDSNAEIIEVIRFQVGEGMEKKEEDFAAEVAKQLEK